MPEHQWQYIRDRKLSEVASRIPPEWQIPVSNLPSASAANVISVPRTCGILSPRELHITEDYSASRLLNALRSRTFTAVEVTTAFSKRAAISHQLTSCITEPLFHSALARAARLDAHLAHTGKPLGPLHGLPISIKDSFHIQGTDSSIGIAALAFNRAPKNASLVDILLAAGAVIHCKTNVPQTLLALDSVNNIFGRTLNPLNRQQWTAGGSSGGEGVLVAMKGSVMGVGTDVGGSVRIPAMCNGVVGFKPSLGRLPAGGQETGQLAASGKVGLEASVGVIARDLDDVGVFMEVVEGSRAWEVEAGIIPSQWWMGEGVGLAGKRPVIGILWTDGVVEPLPPVKRVMGEVAEKLKSKGIDVVDVNARRFKDCQSLANKFFGVEGGNYLFDLLEKTGEPLIPWLASRLKGKTPATVNALRDLFAKKMQLQDDFLSCWKDPNGRPIDAFICPVAPHPVPPIDRWNSISYTCSFVLLDYPAATLPVRPVNQAELKEEMKGEALGSWDRANRELWDRRTVDREAYLSSPLSVQVVAPKLQERRLWDVMRVIEGAVHGPLRVAKL